MGLGRILAPDITMAADFAVSRITSVIKNLKIYPKKMKINLEKLGGLHNSQKILLSLIQKGMPRNKAYEIIQSISMQVLDSNKNFQKISKKGGGARVKGVREK